MSTRIVNGHTTTSQELREDSMGRSRGRSALLRLAVGDSMAYADKFLRQLRVQEKQDFPVFDKFTAYQNGEYWYFSPTWHFSHRLLTEELLEDIRSNKRQVLSVGSGPAYLERFLVNRLGVGTNQITLSDDASNVMPANFRSFVFDMYSTWPSFDRPFDYVIFPESTLSNDGFPGPIKRQEKLLHVMRSSLSVTEQNGQVRILGELISSDQLITIRNRLKDESLSSDLSFDQYTIVIKR